MLITEQYRQLNKELHQVRPDYGSNGHRLAQAVVDLAKNLETRDVLDYGCGKGTLRTHLPMVDVKNYDPAFEEWSADPKPADIVVCLDVLEHIEPECLDDVLKHIKSLTQRALMLCVATRPAVKFLPDGRNAHLIQEPIMWWLNRLDDVIGFPVRQITNMDEKEFVAIYKNPEWQPSENQVSL